MEAVVDKLENISEQTCIALDLLDYVLEGVNASGEAVLGNLGRITNILNVLWERLCSLDEIQKELIHELLQKKMPQQSGNSSKGKSKYTTRL